ncbi:hypothetical protein [Paenibacillus sp. S25]|jgi:hypothetical protein|uniref:hypothetical protein n=1 Tax=Paenibacillus sp. S25 TaxID=2823905 RepID=UPI001C64EF34|nr:hypothetical protein [Paenibacillus sp. S25]QYK61865.1 hypothetical protein KAI37_02189 [Paenibacillus sp. S25]
MEYIELDDESLECAVSPEFLNLVLWLLGPTERDKFLYPVVAESVDDRNTLRDNLLHYKELK